MGNGEEKQSVQGERSLLSEICFLYQSNDPMPGRGLKVQGGVSYLADSSDLKGYFSQVRGGGIGG